MFDSFPRGFKDSQMFKLSARMQRCKDAKMQRCKDADSQQK